MVNCRDCSNLTSHSTKLAAQGFGNCKLSTEWRYISTTYKRDCAQFLEVTPEVAKLRADWDKAA